MANSIDGRIVDATGRRPIPGLTVEAVGRLQGDLVGTATTDLEGVFSIQVDPRRFKQLVARAEDVGFGVTAPNREPRWIT